MSQVPLESSEETVDANSGIQVALPQNPPRNPKSFATFRAEFIDKNDDIRTRLATIKGMLPAADQNSTIIKALESSFKPYNDNENIPPALIEQNVDIREGLQKQHNERMDVLNKLKDQQKNNPDANLKDQLRALEQEIMELHQMSLSFAAEREDTLREENVDQDARETLLGAYRGATGRNDCTFEQMLNDAKQTGIKFKFGLQDADLTISKDPEGKLVIKSYDPQAMVQAAAAMGLKSIKILDGTSTADAIEIMNECNKRGIQVRNANTFQGKDNLLNKIYAVGAKSSDFKSWVNNMISSATPLEQGRFKDAALTNAQISSNWKFSNRDGQTTSKNDVFSDAATTRENREVVNILQAMKNGARPDAIRQMLVDESPERLVAFIQKAEEMIGKPNPTTHQMEYKVPNGETPAQLIDIQQYVKEKLLKNDSAKWAAVERAPNFVSRIVQEEQAPTVSHGASSSR